MPQQGSLTEKEQAFLDALRAHANGDGVTEDETIEVAEAFGYGWPEAEAIMKRGGWRYYEYG